MLLSKSFILIVFNINLCSLSKEDMSLTLKGALEKYISDYSFTSDIILQYNCHGRKQFNISLFFVSENSMLRL
jgi:hypothetical protein